MPEAKTTVEQVAERHGWTLEQMQEPRAVTRGAATTLTPGNYTAYKRLTGTDTMVERQGETPELLAERIEAWEASQPGASASDVALTEEMLEAGAKATVNMAVTGGARVSHDVNLVPAPAEPKPRIVRITANLADPDPRNAVVTELDPKTRDPKRAA